MKVTLQTLAGAVLAAVFALAVGASAYVYYGGYDVSAVEQHTAPVYRLVEQVMRQSIRARVEGQTMPALGPGALDRGLQVYRAHCTQCHGAPGVAPEPFALGMTPVPANLVDTARLWTAEEIHWAVRNGIKMTGMPAWLFRLDAKQLWEVTAFVVEMRALSPQDYRQWSDRVPPLQTMQSTAGRPADDASIERGRAAVSQYACTSCHTIPDMIGARPQVGPPLGGLARRKYLAGQLPNTPENLARWIREPQVVDPLSAMPNLGVSEADARDMAAYLLTLDDTP